MAYLRWPLWLKDHYREIQGNALPTTQLIREKGLNTVCQAANCPNRSECFGNGTATFLIMGSTCTRDCRFCNIQSGAPEPLDHDEIARIVESVGIMGLKYVVITSVTRDDLPMGGAEHFHRLAVELKNRYPEIKLEFLIPDMQGNESAMQMIADSPLDILNHNVETVAELYSQVRPQADFDRSLNVLAFFHARDMITKSGIMTGLGESFEQLKKTMGEIRRVGVSILTIGQYLQPSLRHFPVKKYYTFEEFDVLRDAALQEGFEEVYSGPFVRSSYRAHETKLV